MSCNCLIKYHGRASRDALRGWSGWASTVIHGPRYEPDYGPRYEPDYGPCYAPGRRATLRVGPPGRATRRAAGQRHAPGRGPRRTPDQLQCHRAAGPSDQRTDDADTYQWTSRTRAPGVYSGGPSQDGPGLRCGCHGKVAILPSFPIARWEIAPFHIYPIIREVWMAK